MPRSIARAHDVAVAGAANFRRLRRARFRHDDFLHHRLGSAHGIDGICSLVRRQADDRPDTLVDRRRQDVFRAENVGLDRLDRKELAGRHLFERRRVENVIHAVHRVFDGREVAHVADVEPDLFGNFGHLRLKFVPHIVLLLLIAGEDPDLADIRFQKAVKNGISERTGSAGDKKRLVCEECVIFHTFSQVKTHKCIHSFYIYVFIFLYPSK